MVTIGREVDRIYRQAPRELVLHGTVRARESVCWAVATAHSHAVRRSPARCASRWHSVERARMVPWRSRSPATWWSGTRGCVRAAVGPADGRATRQRLPAPAQIDKCRAMADMQDDDYKRMVCVEPGHVAGWRTLGAGERWAVAQALEHVEL